MSPHPIIILGGHEHQTGLEYPVEIGNFTTPYPNLLKDNKDINCIFMESENYFKSLTLLDFEITDNVLQKVNRTILKTNVAEMLKESKLEKFDDAVAKKIQDKID